MAPDSLLGGRRRITEGLAVAPRDHVTTRAREDGTRWEAGVRTFIEGRVSSSEYIRLAGLFAGLTRISETGVNVWIYTGDSLEQTREASAVELKRITTHGYMYGDFVFALAISEWYESVACLVYLYR